MNIINVNVQRHGDGKQVVLRINTNQGEFIIKGDSISIVINKDLPNILDPRSQVSVWQDAQ